MDVILRRRRISVVSVWSQELNWLKSQLQAEMDQNGPIVTETELMQGEEPKGQCHFLNQKRNYYAQATTMALLLNFTMCVRSIQKQDYLP